jgi:hypothetical protein
VVFVFRFLDSGLRCYHRIIPVDCTIRPSDAEATLAAAAVAVARKKLAAHEGIQVLLQTDLSQYDGLFRSRFQFALRGLKLITGSIFLSNFVLGRTASEVFDRFSPLALELGMEGWRAANEVRYGQVPVLLKLPLHSFLVVLAEDPAQNKLDWAGVVHEIDRRGTFSVVRMAEAANADLAELVQLLRMG